MLTDKVKLLLVLCYFPFTVIIITLQWSSDILVLSPEVVRLFVVSMQRHKNRKGSTYDR